MSGKEWNIIYLGWQKRPLWEIPGLILIMRKSQTYEDLQEMYQDKDMCKDMTWHGNEKEIFQEVKECKCCKGIMVIEKGWSHGYRQRPAQVRWPYLCRKFGFYSNFNQNSCHMTVLGRRENNWDELWKYVLLLLLCGDRMVVVCDNIGDFIVYYFILWTTLT